MKVIQARKMRAQVSCINFEDSYMGTKWIKAPNLVQLFFSVYEVILEGEPPPNSTLTINNAITMRLVCVCTCMHAHVLDPCSHIIK